MDDYDNITESFFGALAGLRLLFWFEEPFFFTGDAVLVGGVLGGVIGYLWGHDIIAFISHFFGP